MSHRLDPLLAQEAFYTTYHAIDPARDNVGVSQSLAEVPGSQLGHSREVNTQSQALVRGCAANPHCFKLQNRALLHKPLCLFCINCPVGL